MDIYHTIVRPVITEKSSRLAGFHSEQRGGAYCFEVLGHASKPQIRDAVEKIYGVKVLEVRTTIKKGKARRFRARIGRTADTKKAIVVVHKDSHINLF